MARSAACWPWGRGDVPLPRAAVRPRGAWRAHSRVRRLDAHRRGGVRFEHKRRPRRRLMKKKKPNKRKRKEKEKKLGPLLSLVQGGHARFFAPPRATFMQWDTPLGGLDCPDRPDERDGTPAGPVLILMGNSPFGACCNGIMHGCTFFAPPCNFYAMGHPFFGLDCPDRPDGREGTPAGRFGVPHTFVTVKRRAPIQKPVWGPPSP